MKLTLIRPNIGSKNGRKYKEAACMEPYALAVVAGVTPPDVEIEMIDNRLEEIDYDSPTDLVAITLETYTAKRAYQIAKHYKDRNVPVIMGGFHVSSIPEEAAKHADAIVAGEVEPIWETVIDDFKAGKLKKIYQTGYTCEMKGYLPNRSIFKGKKYTPMTLTHFTRGCPYRCTFCPDARLYKGGIRFRHIPDVIRDIESQSRELIFFVDNNISANKEKFKEFLREITPLKIKWASQADINVAQDEELIKLMKKSGCWGLVIGFETLNFENLTDMNKPQNIKVFSRYDELIQKLHDNGISIWAALIVGYDSDTPDTFRYMLDFTMKHKFLFVGFNPLVPYFGTPVYNQFKKDNRLLMDNWWLDPNYRYDDVVFQPKHMTPEQLRDGCIDMRKKFSSSMNIIKRAIANRKNLKETFDWKTLLSHAMLFKSDVENKQSVSLGYEEG